MPMPRRAPGFRDLVRLPDEQLDLAEASLVIARDECVEKVRRLFNAPVEDSPELLAVATKTQILTRILNNLKAIYLRQELFAKALPVVDKILLLDPDSPQERRDRALVLVRLKRY